MIYREFEIDEYWLPQFAKYAYAHKDYDGDGDPRCGYSDSIEDCKRQIDEYWEKMEDYNES